jgi:predicted kinase
MLASTRRTTLTLPASALQEAEKIAAERHVTLSTVVAEALEDGLAMRSRTRRAEEVLAAYKTAFSGFTEEERLLLDGIELEPELG